MAATRRSTARCFLVRHGLALILWTSSISLPCPATAGEVRVTGNDCGATVHLVAHDAPLSDVLKELSKTLHFELVGIADADRPVSIDVARRPVDLVARLTGLENVSMTLEENPRCPTRARIVKVWVFPRKQLTSTYPTAAQAEQARREQEGIDMVLGAHGVPRSTAANAKPR